MLFRPRFEVPIPGAEAIPAGLLVALGFVFLVLAAVAIGIVDKGGTAPLAWALLVLISVSAFVRIVPAPEALAALFSTAFYGGLQVARTIQGGNYFPEAFTGFVCFLAIAWLSRSVAQRLSSMEDENQRNATLVEELTMRDVVTGAIKRRHAHQLLVEEVERSRRYNHSLSLLVIDIDDWAGILRERGPEGAMRLLALLAETLVKLLRNVDKVSRHGDSQFAIILPETPLDGARRVAEKIYQQVAEEAKVTVRAGIAVFPTDAVTSEELVAEAEAALQFAKAAELRIVDRSVIS